MTSRTSDPTTSIEAAASIQEHVPRIQQAILVALAKLPAQGAMSTRQLAYVTGIDFATVTPRMCPMEKNGWIRRTTTKYKNPLGKGYGMGWTITPAGRGLL